MPRGIIECFPSVGWVSTPIVSDLKKISTSSIPLLKENAILNVLLTFTLIPKGLYDDNVWLGYKVLFTPS